MNDMHACFLEIYIPVYDLYMMQVLAGYLPYKGEEALGYDIYGIICITNILRKLQSSLMKVCSTNSEVHMCVM